jgi:hypothetical protein
VRERHTLANQAVDRGRYDMWVPQGADRVEALLIGAIPENIWSCAVGHESAVDQERLSAMLFRAALSDLTG